MTTIAFRDGIMACDSRMTGGYIAVCKSKIVEGRDCLVGFSGDAIAGHSGAMYLAGEMQDRPVTSKDDVWFLVYRDKRLYLADSEFRELPLDGNKYFAIGSGEQAAMVAMHMGASAAEAVKMAIRVDENSGGTVREYSL